MTLVWTLLVLLVPMISCSPKPQPPVEELKQALTPVEGANVIVISFDALRRDGLSLYGNPRQTSPQLDAFAEQSVVFDRAYSVAPVTPTSFAAAFTGMLPTRVFHRWKLVYPDTLASRFQDQGYRTAAVLNNIQLSVERNFDVGFETYEVLQQAEDEEVVDKALAWLAANKEEKLFGWFHFISPHSPYEARAMADAFYDPSYEGEFQTTSTAKFHTSDPDEIQRLKDLYEGEVFYGDHLFERLLRGIDELGLLENSFVVVTSDHGEEFFEHLEFQHDRLTEEHVQIPLLLRHPEGRSLRSPLLVSNVDLLPTLLSLVGLEFNGVVDGKNLLTLDSEPQRLLGISMTGGKRRWLSLRKGDQKLIQTCLPEAERSLYDLALDPHEIAPQTGGAVADALASELEVVLGGDPCDVMTDAVRGVAPEAGLPVEQIEALRSLGYLGGN